MEITTFNLFCQLKSTQHAFKRGTRVAVRPHHFIVETIRYKVRNIKELTIKTCAGLSSSEAHRYRGDESYVLKFIWYTGIDRR